MPPRTFASRKELQDYAAQTGKVCRLEGVAKRQRLLSPDQYEIVDVHNVGDGLTFAEQSCRPSHHIELGYIVPCERIPQKFGHEDFVMPWSKEPKLFVEN